MIMQPKIRNSAFDAQGLLSGNQFFSKTKDAGSSHAHGQQGQEQEGKAALTEDLGKEAILRYDQNGEK
jgi:hypothetical protein